MSASVASDVRRAVDYIEANLTAAVTLEDIVRTAGVSSRGLFRRFRHGTEREQSPTPFLDAIDTGLFERMGDTVPARPRDRQLRLL